MLQISKTKIYEKIRNSQITVTAYFEEMNYFHELAMRYSRRKNNSQKVEPAHSIITSAPSLRAAVAFVRILNIFLPFISSQVFLLEYVKTWRR